MAGIDTLGDLEILLAKVQIAACGVGQSELRVREGIVRAAAYGVGIVRQRLVQLVLIDQDAAQVDQSLERLGIIEERLAKVGFGTRVLLSLVSDRAQVVPGRGELRTSCTAFSRC